MSTEEDTSQKALPGDACSPVTRSPSSEAQSVPSPNDFVPDSSNPSNDPLPIKSKLWLQAMAIDVLDKQYRLYSWNDAKSLSLITTDSILLAAIGFLFKECLSDVFALLSITVAFILLGLSLFFSLRQVIPQGSSGKGGSTPNLRALSGITSFQSWQAYYKQLSSIDEERAFTDATRQIYGMAFNNDTSRKATTTGVRLTLVGIVFIWFSALGVSLSARDVHLLGAWSPPAQGTARNVEPKQPPDKAVNPAATSPNNPMSTPLAQPTKAVAPSASP